MTPNRGGGAVHAPTLTTKEIATFWEQGYLLLGPCAPPEDISTLCLRADEVLLGDIQYPGMTFQLCPSAVDQADAWGKARQRGNLNDAVAEMRSLKWRKVQGWERDEHYLRYMSLPIFRDAAEKIIGQERISVFRSMFFNKPAAQPGVSKGGVVINWHQDGNTNGGWGLSVDPRLTIWTALDKCTVANGCVSLPPVMNGIDGR